MKKNWNTLAVLAGIIVVSGSIPSCGAPHAKTEDVIRAHRFEIVNDKQEIVASLAAIPEVYPGFLITLGDDRMARIALYDLPNGAVVITLDDRAQLLTFGVSLDPEGTSKVGFEFSDGNASSSLGISSSGSPFAEFVNRERKNKRIGLD
ncbi:MAG: hypothetical protein ACE5EQ_05375 [Phycisphaerae bacterium]